MEKEEVQGWVKEAVAEALRSANLVDGPTHIKHHQMIEEFCDTFCTVKKAGLTAAVVTGIGILITLVGLGVRSWIASGGGGNG